ncbi:hypothetical protein HNP81_000307 [Peribacillus huizhouensis]|uniref:Uncharacterized protein n=1 Tax=Peribacillus huizhouensis TaxID=1501239 RepID=A0ABR6CJ23_9BACI|nr:hypothetical protein [Peribacillus huizhouensis]
MVSLIFILLIRKECQEVKWFEVLLYLTNRYRIID